GDVDFDTLIDDPDAWADRQDYFSSGAQRWVTGVGDALWQVFADPTIVGAKIGGVVKAGRGALKAGQVAKVGAVQRGEAAAETLTRKERHFSTLVHDFAVAFDKTEPGQIASAAETKWLKNTRDGGAIAYMMRRAGEGIDDVAERIAAREEVLLAGMGDKVALGRLGERNAKLAAEMRRLDGEIEEMAAAAEWAKAGSDDEALGRMYSVLDDSPISVADKKALAADVRKEILALDRVAKVGAPIDDAANVAGDLANLPVSWLSK